MTRPQASPLSKWRGDVKTPGLDKAGKNTPKNTGVFCHVKYDDKQRI